MFFEILSDLCKKNNITVTSLVLKLGFSSSNATTWKNNKPSTEALIKIADYFNVSVDYLLGRTDNPNDAPLEKEERQLLESFNSLSSQGKEFVLQASSDYLLSENNQPCNTINTNSINYFTPNIQLAETIKALCSKKHISISQMLSECNMPYSFIQQLERSVSPSIEALEKIADYFQLSVNDILENTLVYDEAEGKILNLCDTVYLKAISTSVTVNEILSVILKLNEFGKTKVLEYAKDLSVNALYKINNSSAITDSEHSAQKHSEARIAANEEQSVPPIVKKKPRHT